MIAYNDNLTIQAFEAGLAPTPSEPVWNQAVRPVVYALQVRERMFTLVRTGMTRIMPEMRHRPAQFASFPTAGIPHRFSPPSFYRPPEGAWQRGANSKVRRPAFIRGVIAGTN